MEFWRRLRLAVILGCLASVLCRPLGVLMRLRALLCRVGAGVSCLGGVLGQSCAALRAAWGRLRSGRDPTRTRAPRVSRPQKNRLGLALSKWFDVFLAEILISILSFF